MDVEGALEGQNAAEEISEETLHGEFVGAAGMEHPLLYCLTSLLPPQKISGTNFF